MDSIWWLLLGFGIYFILPLLSSLQNTSLQVSASLLAAAPKAGRKWLEGSREEGARQRPQPPTATPTSPSSVRL